MYRKDAAYLAIAHNQFSDPAWGVSGVGELG